MGVKKITICHKRNDCIGCGSCEIFAPRYWSMSQTDGRADLKGSVDKGDFYVAQVDEDDFTENKIAAISCPVQVIRVEGFNN